MRHFSIFRILYPVDHGDEGQRQSRRYGIVASTSSLARTCEATRIVSFMMKSCWHRKIVYFLVALLLILFRKSDALASNNNIPSPTTTTTTSKQQPHFPIRHQFNALSKPKKGVLSIVPLPLPPSEENDNNVLIVAVAGHDGGHLNLWDISSSDDDDDRPPHRISFADHRIHQGSIFALHVSGSSGKDTDINSVGLISGSFDRSSSWHQLTFISNEGKVEVQKKLVGQLPEHTGWARQVKGMSILEEDGQDINTYNINLSIGCNLINVWTAIEANDNDNGTTTTATLRIARLDAGPSPDDDPQEDAFRRHDILCLDVLMREDNKSYIVAGLVDGSVRLFDVSSKEWTKQILGIMGKENNNRNTLDATGGCRPFENYEDERPLLSFYAHEKGTRVCNVHAMYNSDRFVTVGYDGQWIVWKIKSIKDNHSQQQVKNDDMVERICSGTSENNDRIVSSCVFHRKEKENGDGILFFATVEGKIYQVKELAFSSANDGKQELVFDLKRESTLNDGNGDDENQSITCLSTIGTVDDKGVKLIVGLSTGEVLIFDPLTI